MNQQKWNVAIVQLDALRKDVPRLVTEERVAEYHVIVAKLQELSGDDNVLIFRIPDGEMKQTVVGGSRPTRRHPGHVTYSKDKYCDVHYFKRQVEALWQYVQKIKPGTEQANGNTDKPTDYWSLSDGELERLASRINVPPASLTPNGEWFIDRDRIINTLLKRDQALRESNSQSSHVVHVDGGMYGSSIQLGTSDSNVTINFKTLESDVKNILANIRGSVDKIDLPEIAKRQLSADANTIEVQLASPQPKTSVIRECLHSARTILEGAAGSAIASGIVIEIAKVLAHH